MKYLIKILAHFVKVPTMPEMNYEQEMGLFSELYQNATFRKYLDARENYLINKHTEDFLAGKINNSFALGGQLLEVRNLRDRTKVAYKYIDNSHKVSPNPKK